MKKLAIIIFIALHGTTFSQVSFHETWVDPLLVCNGQPIAWKSFDIVQSLPPVDFQTCIQPFENVSQVWLRFVVKSEAPLAFIITPDILSDDIDFVLFESKDGVPGATIRCMATGLSLDRNSSGQLNCSGRTGLINTEHDQIEPPGCQSDQNNFGNAPVVTPLTEFMLLITNYRSSHGFLLEWLNEIELEEDLCISQPDKLRMAVHPNPTRDIMYCDLLSPDRDSGFLRIVSGSGTVMKKIRLELSMGKNIYQIPSEELAAGSYFLHFSSEHGTTCFTSFEIVK